MSVNPNNPTHMQAVIESLDAMFNETRPKQVGLVLLTFPYGSKDGQANYITNGASREDMITFLEETAKRLRDRQDTIKLPWADIDTHRVPIGGIDWQKALGLLGVRYESISPLSLKAGVTRIVNVHIPRSVTLPSWVSHPPVANSNDDADPQPEPTRN